MMGFEDFVKANRDLSNLSDDQILQEYYSMTESDLDNDDIKYLMDDKFGYDEDLDDQKEIKKKNIAKKREISKAKTESSTEIEQKINTKLPRLKLLHLQKLMQNLPQKYQKSTFSREASSSGPRRPTR